MVGVVNSSVQLRALRKFCRNTDTLNDGTAALEWLLQPPRRSMTLSPESVRNAFMYRSYYNVPDADIPLLLKGLLPPSICHLMVPCHFLSECVLGVVFERMPDFATGQPTACGMPPEDDIFHDDTLGFDSVLSHFVYEYRTSRFLMLSRAEGGHVSFGGVQLRQHGLRDMHGGRVFPDGSVMAMGSKSLCQYCSQRYHQPDVCECPPAMADRMEGRTVSLQSWDQLLDLGRGFDLFYNGYKGCFLPDVIPMPVDLSLGCMFVDYHFVADSEIMDVRSSYLNHVTVETLSIVLNPSASRDFELVEGSHEYLMMGPDDDGFLDEWALEHLSGDSEEAVLGEWISMDGEAGSKNEKPVRRRGRPRQRYICGVCGIEFPKSHSLKRHVAAIHEQKRANKCSDCDLTFTQLANLKRHRQSVHLGVKPFSCDICGSAFGQRANLQRHRQSKHASE